MVRARFLCLALVLALAGCVGLDNSLVYWPVPGPKPYEAPPAPLQDLDLQTADGTKIHARWAPNPNATGAILYCHGNGGNIEFWGGAIKQIWRNLDESVLIFDYPGYGYSGGKPSEQGCYAAAQAAYQWLTDVQKIPADKIVIFGESLGGGVAVDLASRKPHRALVLVRTFATLPEVAEEIVPLPVAWLMTNRFESINKIKDCKRPIFIAHGDSDMLIPIRHAERLAKACPAPPQFYIMHGIGHNDPLPGDCYLRLRQFLVTN